MPLWKIFIHIFLLSGFHQEMQRNLDEVLRAVPMDLSDNLEQISGSKPRTSVDREQLRSTSSATSETCLDSMSDSKLFLSEFSWLSSSSSSSGSNLYAVSLKRLDSEPGCLPHTHVMPKGVFNVLITPSCLSASDSMPGNQPFHHSSIRMT